MVVRLGRPCAFFTTSSGMNPCSRAHPAQTRATAGVESTRTPSKSKSTPRQRIFVMNHDRRKPLKCETRSRATFHCCALAGAAGGIRDSRDPGHVLAATGYYSPPHASGGWVPEHHRDQFDRLLVVQAISERMTL